MESTEEMFIVMFCLSSPSFQWLNAISECILNGDSAANFENIYYYFWKLFSNSFQSLASFTFVSYDALLSISLLTTWLEKKKKVPMGFEWEHTWCSYTSHFKWQSNMLLCNLKNLKIKLIWVFVSGRLTFYFGSSTFNVDILTWRALVGRAESCAFTFEAQKRQITLCLHTTWLKKMKF